ncbi:hypothetical protein ACC793_37620, partial [Rhizobium ruizarguesonis]
MRIIKTILFDGIDCTDGCVDAHDPPFRSPRSEEFISQTCEPFNGEPASAGNGSMVAFMAKSRAEVDAFYD